MRKELQSDPEYNLDFPAFKNISFCKSIRPKNGAAGGGYFGILPRIVKSDFKVPANWEVVEEVAEGQVLDISENKYTNSVIEYVHTCNKPFVKCVRGFWVRMPTSQKEQ